MSKSMGVKRDHDSIDKPVEETKITDEEAALYDRQIRLWGVNCQKRLRDAKVLIIGLNGLGIEVVKNLTLSGVKSITIMDQTPVSELDYSAQYYVVGSELGTSRAEASKSSIQELNPNVTIIIEKEPLETKNSRFFANFSVVFASGIPLDDLIKVNNACHDQEVLFSCGDTWGFYGYGFLDLLEHQFSKKKKIETKTESREENILRNFKYCRLESTLKLKFGSGLNKRTSSIFILFHIMNHFYSENKRFPSPLTREADYDLLKSSRDKIVKDLNCDASKVSDEILKSVFGELSPVCAATGGIIANDIIKGISKQGEPLCNFLFFDGDDCTGAVQQLISNS